MASPSTLHRFQIDVSDIDRGFYEHLSFRVAKHPSEISAYMLTRVLAYALNFAPGLEFSPGGLSDPDAPGLCTANPAGGMSVWIEIGNPSARKLHKAAKASDKVIVYTYKDPHLLLKDIKEAKVHRVEEIEIYSFTSGFLAQLETLIERDNRWTLTHTEGSLVITTSDKVVQGELLRHLL